MERAAQAEAAGGDETALIRGATANDLATLLRVRDARGGHTDHSAGLFRTLLSHHNRQRDLPSTAREWTETAGPLPALRIPDRPDAPRHIPVDPVTLARVKAGLEALPCRN